MRNDESRSCVTPRLVLSFYKLKTSAVSTTAGWLKLNFANCVGTSDTLIWRSCAMFDDMCNMVLVNCIYDMVDDTQFHKFHDTPFARILYVLLMKDIGR